jgi:hypothetical protein
MMDATKNAIVDNPVVNFFKNHWGKLLLGIGFLFLKPSQMKKVWEALKSAGLWLWKNAPKIFEGVWSILQTVGKLMGDLIDWLFGQTDKERAQDDVDNMERKEGLFGIGGETPEEFEKRKKDAQAKVDKMQDGGKRTGGLSDSLFKKIAVGLGGLAVLLVKFGPKGTLFKAVELGAKGIWKTAKGLTSVIKNPGEAIDNTAKYLGDKAGKVKNVASKVGGVAKNVGKVGGDWFKTLMGKFGSAGKFLMKMGKSVIQGLMTMGPYGWAILAGIAIGGLVWYFWDDISKAWDNIASTISEGFKKIKDSIVGAFGNIQGMVGGWLRGIGANMIADWVDPKGADPEKKEEFTWGGFAGELWDIYTGIWKSIYGFLRIGEVRTIVAKWLRGVGAGLIADWIEPDEAKKTGEEFSFQNIMKSIFNIYTGWYGTIMRLIGIDVDGIRSAVASWLRGMGASIIADWIEPDEAKKENEKEVTFINIAQELSSALTKIWDDMWAALKDIDVVGIVKNVAGGVKDAVTDFVGLGPDTPEEIKQKEQEEYNDALYNPEWKGNSILDRQKLAEGITNKKLTREKLEWIIDEDDLSKEDMEYVKMTLKQHFPKETAKPIPVKTPPTTEKKPESKGGFFSGLFGGGKDKGTERAQKKLEDVRNMKSTKERNDRIKGILKGPDGKEFYEAMSPEEQNKHRGAAMLGGIITKEQALSMKPGVSPTLKADTLNKVQGENAELSSASTAIIAPVTNNYITNNNGGEGGGTAIYGVPTAQKGNQHRHSNIK